MTNKPKQGEVPKEIPVRGARDSKGSSKKGLIGQGGGFQGDQDPKGSEARDPHKGCKRRKGARGISNCHDPCGE